MKTHRLPRKIYIIVLILLVSTLACQIFSREPTPEGTGTATQATEPETATALSPTEIQPVDPTEEPPPEPEIELGEVFRSEEGGYAFRPLPDYEVEEFSGFTTMIAVDGNEDSGPMILMWGEVAENELTLNEFIYATLEDISSEDVTFSNPVNVTIGGKPGRTLDIKGTAGNGVDMAGKITMVLASPTQTWILLTTVPVEQWSDFLPLVEVVEASVTFFEPELEIFPTEEPGALEETPDDEIHQWAAHASASSSYSDPDWHADRATGAPDTNLQECEDHPNAWASLAPDTVEWLELSYETAVVPTEIHIFQTHSPDQVVKVEILDTLGAYHQVYTGEPQDMWEQCPYELSIPVDADYMVKAVKITIDQSVIPAPWNQIDAVELVGSAAEDAVTTAEEVEPPSPLESPLFLQDPPIPSKEAGLVNDKLMELGYEVCEPSDFFTIQTESAVIRFQEVNDLDVDGVVGPQTWGQLFSDDAISAPLPSVGDLPAYIPPSPVGGGEIAYAGGLLWVLTPGFRTLEAFKIGPEVGQEYAGIFSIEPSNGENDYMPQTLTSDGTSLWVASTGDDDATLQSYDFKVDPVVGVLSPQLAKSIHIEDVLTVRGLFYDGQNLWLAFEGTRFPSGLVSIDPGTGLVGEVIEFGMEAYVNTPTFDGEQLWVPVEGYYGGQAIRSVNPVSGDIGKPLGICGTHVVYDRTALWVAKERELWIVDPYDGEPMVALPLEIGQVRSMIFAGAGVWVIDWDGGIQYFRIW